MALKTRAVNLWAGALILLLASGAGCATKKELQIFRGELSDLQRELKLLQRREAELATEVKEGERRLAELAISMRESEARLKRAERQLGIATERLEKLAGRSAQRAEKRPPPDSRPRAFEGIDRSLKPVPLYERSLRNYRAGLHRMALQGFEEFLRLFPQHRLSENAQYWLGESYYAARDYARARAEFEKVLKGWPGGRKEPDAMLKVGLCLLALGEGEGGRKALRELIRRHPRHRASEIARKRLKALPGD